MEEKFQRKDVRKDVIINKSRVENEFLQLRANKFNEKREAERSEIFKESGIDIEKKLTIEISPNLKESFYFENYVNENNINEKNFENLFNLLLDKNQEIRKFAIRNICDIINNNKKIYKQYFKSEHMNHLINYVFSTKNTDEIYEISSILITLTFSSSVYCQQIFKENVTFFTYINNYLTNYHNFDQVGFLIASNYVYILTNIISDNNWQEDILNQLLIFEKININLIFQLFEDIGKFPSSMRKNIIWFVSNILKIPIIADEKENEKYPIIQFLITQLTNFFLSEKILKIILKFFKNPIVNETTQETINLLSQIFKLAKIDEKIEFEFISQNFSLGERLQEIFECEPSAGVLNSCFELCNNIIELDLNFKYNFFDVYNITLLIPKIIELIYKEIKKYACETPYKNFPYAGDKKKRQMFSNNIQISADAPIVKLLENTMFYLFLCAEKKENSFADYCFRTDDLIENTTTLYSLILKGGITKHNEKCIEKFLLFLSQSLNSTDSSVSLIGCISGGILELLSEFMKNLQNYPQILNLVLKCIESLLITSQKIIVDHVNIVGDKLERLGAKDYIDKLRMDSNDDIATISDSIIETFFRSNNN